MNNKFSINEAVLLAFIDGKLPADEAAAVERWYDASEENRKMLEQLCFAVFLSDRAEMIRSLDPEKSLAQLKLRIAEKERRVRRRTRFAAAVRRSMRYAAAALLLVAVAGVTAYLGRRDSGCCEIVADGVANKTIVLPDKSTVVLKPDSRISFPSDFTADNRVVKLDGEALFDVANIKGSEFCVKAHGARIVVKGTRFSFKAYSDSPNVEAVLVDGAIDFRSSRHNIAVKPNQKVVYDTDSRRVNIIDATGVTTLKQLIQRIEAGSDYRVSWRDNLPNEISVSVSGGERTVDELLKEALRDKDITYVIKQNDIILLPRENRPAPARTTSAKRSDRVIGGTVLDAETGQPVIGASVWIKNSTIGTTADIDGKFSLKYDDANSVLAVSFLGYEEQEFPLNTSATNLVVKLKTSASAIEDVVIVGYGVQKKASVVGAISSVAVDDLKAPVAKLSGNIAGQLAGVVSIQRSGEPGAGSTFWIRGISTFGSSKTPLVLVDGIERDMDLVNVDDIASMSILKDASATAIYGVRGANGVVMITTRDGQIGKPKVSLSVEAGLLSPTRMPEMLDATQFATMYNAASGREVYSPTDIEKYVSRVDPDLYPNVNWLGELYKSHSYNEKVNLSISGGGEIAKYYISGAFYNEDGLFAVDNMKNYDTSLYYRRYNFRSNVDVQVFRHTKLNINLATSFERKNEPGSSASSIWNYALTTAPNAFPMRYSDGTLAGPADNDGYSPYVLLTQKGYREKFWNTATSTINLNQDFGNWITPGLTANLKFAFDAMNFQDLSRTKTP